MAAYGKQRRSSGGGRRRKGYGPSNHKNNNYNNYNRLVAALFGGLCCCVVLLLLSGLVLVVWWFLFFPRDGDPLAQQRLNQQTILVRRARRIRNQLRRRGGGGGRGKHRIAVIIPFVADGVESIPPYLDLFCAAAQGSSSLVDFFLIHNGVLQPYQDYHYSTDANNNNFDNVRFINLGSTEAMANKLVQVVDQRGDDLEMDSMEQFSRIIARYIERFPYVLVEFKPALGHIFSEYLEVSVTTTD